MELSPQLPVHGSESSLFIPVPESEFAVEKIRKHLDPSRDGGVPAHITVLYPFVPPDEITTDDLELLRRIFLDFEAFDYSLREVRWFEQRVVYLAPDAPGPFVDMTSRLVECFPICLPYRGAYQDVVPHLCVAENANARAMRKAAGRVAKRVPIDAHAREVWLMTGDDSPNSWALREVFPLRNRD